MKQLILLGRLIFGAWMLASGANYFFVSLWPQPVGQEPLAIQLMASLVHSGLLGVAMTIQLVTGALILTGLFVPVALCVVMPISTCALYWSVILDHQPLGTVLALAAFALNGLLMLAYLAYYRGALQRQALTFGEPSAGQTSFDFLFVNPNGRTPRGQFVAALVTLAGGSGVLRVPGEGRHCPLGHADAGVPGCRPACPTPARHGVQCLAAGHPRRAHRRRLRQLAACREPLRRPIQHCRAPRGARRVRRVRALGLHWQRSGRSQSVWFVRSRLRRDRGKLRRNDGHITNNSLVAA